MKYTIVDDVKRSIENYILQIQIDNITDLTLIFLRSVKKFSVAANSRHNLCTSEQCLVYMYLNMLKCMYAKLLILVVSAILAIYSSCDQTKLHCDASPLGVDATL